ncbi:MAG: hypothetical protein L0229_28935 [Blastocatellia bacterium]|nr:hypothetical protein [Blastocatellia bacterium]
MQRYYDVITEQQFLSDLSKKDSVILLRDNRSDTIQGFSTLMKVRIEIDGRSLRAVFSGDTVIEKDYWGSRALGIAFLRYMFIEKLKSPFSPLYWLLITKGYKTYLMMANNFAEHYPRFERETPACVKRILDAFYSTLYGDCYDPETGRIERAGDATHLRPGIAAISNALTDSNPRIAFFQRANPGWQNGAELACIARMTVFMPFYYAAKVFLKDRVLKPLRRFSRFALSLPKERDRNPQ